MQSQQKTVKPVVKLFINGEKASGKTSVAEVVTSALEGNGYIRTKLPSKKDKQSRVIALENEFHCVAIYEEE